MTFRERKYSSLLGSAFKQEFRQCQDNLQIIYFPFCHNSHWYVRIINLLERHIGIAEGLGRSPPIRFVQTLKFLLGDILKKDLSEWKDKKWLRYKCSQQQDSTSCGVIALSFIQKEVTIVSQNREDWNPAQAELYRLLWLERIVGHSVSNGHHDSSQAAAWDRIQTGRVPTLANAFLMLSAALGRILQWEVDGREPPQACWKSELERDAKARQKSACRCEYAPAPQWKSACQ